MKINNIKIRIRCGIQSKKGLILYQLSKRIQSKASSLEWVQECWKLSSPHASAIIESELETVDELRTACRKADAKADLKSEAKNRYNAKNMVHIQSPKNLTCLLPKTHLAAFNLRLALIKIMNTSSNNLRWSDQVFVARQRSSMNTCRCIPLSPAKRAFIRRWKLAGALHNPKGMRLKRNCPSSTRKLVKSFARSLKGICQYPAARSSWLKNMLPDKGSRQSSMFGRG